jgi:hypothetical protein
MLAFGSARADVVNDWNLATVNAGGAHYHLALVHIAMHDAMNAVAHAHPAFAVAAAAPGGPVSVDAAASEAAYRVLKGLAVKAGGPNLAVVEQQYATSMAAIPSDAAKAAGVALGASVAAALLKQRRDDGWPYVPVGGVCPAGARPGPTGARRRPPGRS